MKMRTVALLKGKTCVYGGKRYKEAEHFYMTEQHAKVFSAMKLVQLDPAGDDKEVPDKATQPPSVALVTEVMGMPAQKPRPRGRPRRAAELAE